MPYETHTKSNTPGDAISLPLGSTLADPGSLLKKYRFAHALKSSKGKRDMVVFKIKGCGRGPLK